MALALLGLFLWHLFFVPRAPLDMLALLAALPAIIAAKAMRRPIRTPIDGPMLIYAGLTVLSALVHRTQFSPVILNVEPIPAWQPAAHALVLVVYFWGATALLASAGRVNIAMTAIVLCISVLGILATYNHLIAGFDVRLLNYALLSQWSGYPELGLLFVLAVPFPVALAVVSPSRLVVVASALVALALVGDVAGVYSRGANVGLAVTGVMLLALEIRKLHGTRLLRVALVGAVVLAGLLAAGKLPTRALRQFGTGSYYTSNTTGAYESRLSMWVRASEMIRDHPWLGVGPGNYSDAMATVYAKPGDPLLYRFHAHNMLIQVAAESGIAALLAFLLIWQRLLTRLAGLCARNQNGVLAMGLFGALASLLSRGLGDQFLSGLRTSDRMSVLLWTLFAAAAALARGASRENEDVAQMGLSRERG